MTNSLFINDLAFNDVTFGKGTGTNILICMNGRVVTLFNSSDYKLVFDHFYKERDIRVYKLQRVYAA